MTRLGLAGVGRIGAFHADTLRGFAEVEVVVADADPDRAQRVAEHLDIDWAQDVDVLLASDLDGLVVATPTDTHATLIERGVTAGLPVFCEKPVAESGAKTVEVLTTVEKHAGRVQIGFQRRFDPGYAAARDRLASGSLGWVHTLRGGTLDPAPPPPSFIESSGGIFRDCSVHDFDAIRWVTGREIVEVFATGSNRGDHFFSDYGDVDTAAVVMRLDDDTLALVSATRYNAAGYGATLEILGSKGSIGVGFDDRMPLHSVESAVAWPTGTAYTGFMDRFHEAYVRELNAFLDFAAGRIDSPCTVGDALEALYVAEACDLSRRERRPVEISEVRK